MKLRVNHEAMLDVIEEQLTAAAILGWRRAHKHTDTPTDAAIFEAIHSEIQIVTSQWFPATERD